MDSGTQKFDALAAVASFVIYAAQDTWLFRMLSLKKEDGWETFDMSVPAKTFFTAPGVVKRVPAVYQYALRKSGERLVTGEERGSQEEAAKSAIRTWCRTVGKGVRPDFELRLEAEGDVT